MTLCCEFFLLESFAGVVPTRMDADVCFDRHLVRLTGRAKIMTLFWIIDLLKLISILANAVIYLFSIFHALFELFHYFLTLLWCGKWTQNNFVYTINLPKTPKRFIARNRSANTKGK